MNSHNAIFDKHRGRYAKINEALDKVLDSRVPLAASMGNHALLGQGKRLRPLLFVLSCELLSHQDREVYRLSTIFEYIHTASLLHDDVLDNADTRRKRPSTNQVWGNHAAVLEGDFLYSKAMSVAVSTNSLPLFKRLTETTMRMTEGQILELDHTGDWHTTKEAYMEIIEAKTAVLISAACGCGAIISRAAAVQEKALTRFGLNLGIAFQMIDDMLDYVASEAVFGKPVGKDLKEGKITLPLIYTLSALETRERSELEDLFKSRRATEADYRDLMDRVCRNGAIAQIRSEAGEYIARAARCLDIFPDCPAKTDLLELNAYLLERDY